MRELYDLIEYKYDPVYCAFIKVRTHKTNIPKAIAYSEKKKIEFLTPPSPRTRFQVVPNGAKQYSLKFKESKTKNKKL